MRKNISIVILLGFVGLLTSCSVTFEKRRYRPGYHVEVRKNNQREYQTSLSSPNRIVDKNNLEPVTIKFNEEKPVVKNNFEDIKVSNDETNSSPVNQKSIRENKKRELDSCDVIFTSAGQRIQAKVHEITNEYIHYKRCDDPKGRLYSIKSKLVDNITLGNGELYVPPNRVIVDKEKERKKSEVLMGLSIASLSIGIIAFIFSFFISPFSGLSFGFSIFNLFFSFILLLLDIRPGKFAPSYRTKLTWIFCLIALVLFVAAMVIVLF